MRRGSPPVRDGGHRGPSGFAVLELVVALLLLSVVVAGVAPLLTAGDQAYQETWRRQEMLRNVRTALDQMARQLRAAVAVREARDGLLRFDVATEDGEASTVEYALDPSTGLVEYRRPSRWDYRRRISVQSPPGVTVPAGYSVYVCVDHASLVQAGKSRADGRDVRVRFLDGTRAVELDRVLDPTTTWAGTANLSNCPGPAAERMVKIWFRVQADIPAGQADTRYALDYGNLQAGVPPENADHVFLDYEDGTGLEGWSRRDGRSGGYSPTGEGFLFSASGQAGFREVSRRLAHRDVEVVWRFVSDSNTQDGRQVGVGVRLNDVGEGYRVTPGDGNNNSRLRFRYWAGWAAGGGLFGPSGTEQVQADREYYGRFVAVGPSLRASVWRADQPDPGNAWDLQATDGRRLSGQHYSLVNGERAPMVHAHRFVLVRMRVDPEPTATLGPEEPGAVQPLAALAGPFRAFRVECFDAAGSAIACAQVGSVRQVVLELVARDPQPDPVRGPVPDVSASTRVVLRTP